jgi:hypothetical protein
LPGELVIKRNHIQKRNGRAGEHSFGFLEICEVGFGFVPDPPSRLDAGLGNVRQRAGPNWNGGGGTPALHDEMNAAPRIHAHAALEVLA